MASFFEMIGSYIQFSINNLRNFFELISLIPNYVNLIINYLSMLPPIITTTMSAAIAIILVWMVLGLGPRGGQ